MSDLSVEELQSNIAACQLLFPKWKSGYQVIVADPPWQYNTMYSSLQGVAPYPTMGWEELADMPVGKLADPAMCALFLWATGPLIHKAIALMEHWGFEYKSVFKVWRKTNADGTPVCSPGWWSRSSCEFLLVGTKGSNILKYKTTNSERQEYASVREGHSAKPAAITQAVADFLDVPGPRIELWARRSHPLFDSWGGFTRLRPLPPPLVGLEVPGFFAQASGSGNGTGRRCKPLSIPSSPRAVPRKGKKAHRHLVLAPPAEGSEPLPAPPTSASASAPIPIPNTKPGKRKAPKPPPPPPQRISEEEAFQRLAAFDPDPAKKRKTVHKPGCLCFLCKRPAPQHRRVGALVGAPQLERPAHPVPQLAGVARVARLRGHLRVGRPCLVRRRQAVARRVHLHRARARVPAPGLRVRPQAPVQRRRATKSGTALGADALTVGGATVVADVATDAVPEAATDGTAVTGENVEADVEGAPVVDTAAGPVPDAAAAPAASADT
ncbi:hypothetical protein WJX74_003166 [Apatococcus lobatus]|uniref:mRNA m(6)A methyltransferase n=1 Tax=Apatococcus lobatus TaxID=904363 RepID=A0AAW1QZF8_9CHLO